MPWKIFRENGKSCIYKVTEGGDKIELVHCHKTEKVAIRQLRALYASEDKEVSMENESEVLDDSNDTIPGDDCVDCGTKESDMTPEPEFDEDSEDETLSVWMKLAERVVSSIEKLASKDKSSGSYSTETGEYVYSISSAETIGKDDSGFNEKDFNGGCPCCGYSDKKWFQINKEMGTTIKCDFCWNIFEGG